MKKIKYLEGLRGIAAFIVLLNHLRYACFINEYQKLQQYISSSHLPGMVKTLLTNSVALLLDGDLAVWVFWLLSSYVISIAFFKPARNYDEIVVAYAAKRYFRLLIPVLVSVLAGWLLMTAGLMYNTALANRFGPPYSNGWLVNLYNFKPELTKALLFSVYNTFLSHDSKASYNAVLWTIELEFLGSLFTFSLFGVVRHNRKRYLLYAVLLVAVYALQMYWLCCFIAGHVLCDYDFTRPQWPAAAKKWQHYKKLFSKARYTLVPLVILLIVFARTIFPALHLPSKTHNLFLSFIIVFALLRIGFFQRIFSAAVPFWLGRVSFSLYLIHLPLICSLTSYMVLHHFTIAGKVTAAVVTVILSLAIAWFYTIYIDKNGVKFANRVGDYFKRYSS